MKSFICVIFISIIFIACSDSTSPTNNSNVLFKQVPGCGKFTFPTGVWDSSFIYTFEDNLKIHLSLPANCCPDSNRFDYVYTINGDVIDLIAIDTAAHLCRCTCKYAVEIEVTGLDQNSYQFICTYYGSIYYNERVFR